jgi:hypothetical protein
MSRAKSTLAGTCPAKPSIAADAQSIKMTASANRLNMNPDFTGLEMSFITNVAAKAASLLSR